MLMCMLLTKGRDMRILAVVIALSVFLMDAMAGEIDAYPDPSLGATFGIYSPLGEVSATNPVYSIPSRHNFATYFGQSFVALPGLAQDLTFRAVKGGQPQDGNDGIDFRLLIAETSVVNGLYTPTTIVYSSGVFTLGPQQGAFGDSVAGPDITLNLGGLDLVDGAVYEWVLDTVTPADGVEGSGSVFYRHPDQPDIAGNSSVLVWDLDAASPTQPWINVASIDLAYRLTFSDGGEAHPDLPSLGTLPVAAASSVPEPATSALMLLGLLLAALAARSPNHAAWAAVRR